MKAKTSNTKETRVGVSENFVMGEFRLVDKEANNTMKRSSKEPHAPSVCMAEFSVSSDRETFHPTWPVYMHSPEAYTRED